MIGCRAAIVLALAFTPAVAAAQGPESDHARAERYFSRGRDLVRAGRCAEGITDLRASLELEPSIGAYLNLGDCFAKLGRRENAWRVYREAERLAREKGDERLSRIREDIARLEGAAVRVAVRGAEDVPDLVITVDGSVVPRERVADMLLTADEPHDLEARVPKKEPWHARVVGRPGDFERLVIAFAPSPPSEPRAERHQPAQAARNIVGPWMAPAIGGVVSVVAGAVFGAFALDARAELDATVRSEPSCRGTYPDATCPRSFQERLDPLESDAKTFGTMSTAFFVAGAAAVAVGVALLFWPTRPTTQQASR